MSPPARCAARVGIRPPVICSLIRRSRESFDPFSALHRTNVVRLLCACTDRDVVHAAAARTQTDADDLDFSVSPSRYPYDLNRHGQHSGHLRFPYRPRPARPPETGTPTQASGSSTRSRKVVGPDASSRFRHLHLPFRRRSEIQLAMLFTND